MDNTFQVLVYHYGTGDASGDIQGIVGFDGGFLYKCVSAHSNATKYKVLWVRRVHF